MIDKAGRQRQLVYYISTISGFCRAARSYTNTFIHLLLQLCLDVEIKENTSSTKLIHHLQRLLTFSCRASQRQNTPAGCTKWSRFLDNERMT